jgi:hypothetical protein
MSAMKEMKSKFTMTVSQMEYNKYEKINLYENILCVILHSSHSFLSCISLYLGWPSKYDEWIDVDSHRLQPFLSRARLNARPHLTRSHPGHALNSINLDSLIRAHHASATGGDPTSASLPPGAQPSPLSSQFNPSAANFASKSASYQDTRQLAFDLSAAIATMGERSTDGKGATPLDCSPQLHTFALKLHRSIDSAVPTGNNQSPSFHPHAFALTERMLSLIAPFASHPSPAQLQSPVGNEKSNPLPQMIPVSLTVSAHGGVSSSGSTAIAAAAAAGILPHPSHFISQSVSSLSCMADLSRRNHQFIDDVTRAYKAEQSRALHRLDEENFRNGLAAHTFRHLPFAPGQGFSPELNGSVPNSLQLTVDAAASLSVCSYILLLVQQQLLNRSPLATPRTIIPVSASRPRGHIASLHSLTPLSAGERNYVREVREFLTRLMEMPLVAVSSGGEGTEVKRLRRSALLTSIQLAFALGTADTILDSVLSLLRFFRFLLHSTESSESASSDESDLTSERELLMSLSNLTHIWSHFAVSNALRLLGQQRDEVATTLSEARQPTLQSINAVKAGTGTTPSTTVSSADNTAAVAPEPILIPSLLPPSPISSWSDIAAAAISPPMLPLFPAPASLIGCPLLHPPAIGTDCVRLCADLSGTYIYVLTADYGLMKMGTGENGSIAGQCIRQNLALALHAPFAHIAFVPLPRNERMNPSNATRGHVLMRSQLCPDQLLLIDSESMHLSHAYVPLNGVTHGSDSIASSSSAVIGPPPSPSWSLMYGAGAASPLAGSPIVTAYDPTNLPPLVLPPSWREEVATDGFICDACDGQGCWYPAQVVSVSHDPQTVTVRFDGWSQQHNESIPLDSGRLAPFGSRINTLQRFSKSNQTGTYLLDLSTAVRTYKRMSGRDIFVSPNLNTPEFRAGLHVGSVVDGRDSSEMWYAAKIVKIDGDTVTISFDGQSLCVTGAEMKKCMFKLY